MFEPLKGLFRRHSLRKNASSEPTGIHPLGSIRSVVALVDVEDTTFDECKNALNAFFRERGIKGDIFFFDFRRLTEGERLITSIKTTVLRKDLNWYGRPSDEKVQLMLQGEPDMLLSLIPSAGFPVEYMASCSRARFKVGREQLPGGVFDLVVSGTSDASQLDVFNWMVKILDTIE